MNALLQRAVQVSVLVIEERRAKRQGEAVGQEFPDIGREVDRLQKVAPVLLRDPACEEGIVRAVNEHEGTAVLPTARFDKVDRLAKNGGRKNQKSQCRWEIFLRIEASH